MPYKRTLKSGPSYYSKLKIPKHGTVRRALGTDSARRARELEGAVSTVRDSGYLDLAQAFADGELSAIEIESALNSQQLADLRAELNRPEEMTLEAAAEALMESKALKRASTRSRLRCSLDNAIKHFGATTPIQEVLTTPAIKGFMAARLDAGKAKATVTNDGRALSALVTLAMDSGHITERPEIERYEIEERVRWLRPAEYRRYLDNVRPAFRPALRLLADSGLRLGEMLALTPADLDGDTVRVRKGKTKAARRSVHIPADLAAQLRELEPAEDGTIFGNLPRRSVQKEHNRACKLAGINNMRLHDLRHHHAVTMAKAGLPLGTLKARLGHQTVQMTMKYAGFHPEYSDVGPYLERVREEYSA